MDIVTKHIEEYYGNIPDDADKVEAAKHFYEQAEKDLGWHSVKESIPPIDEEVIVLTDYVHGKIMPNSHYLCYGHIVDKNIAVDYDGWNIPGVTHWMHSPKLEEKYGWMTLEYIEKK